MGGKAQGRAGAEDEEVGLVPRRGWKTQKIVGVLLMLLLLRPGVHLVGKRRMNLQVPMLQVHGQNGMRMTHDSRILCGSEEFIAIHAVRILLSNPLVSMGHMCTNAMRLRLRSGKPRHCR